MPRILVCGGRDYCNSAAGRAHVFDVLDALARSHQWGRDTCIIQGGAAGVDTQARAWAQAHILQVETYKADWEKFGKAAGPIRNRVMLEQGKPDVVIAFPGGRGTANMTETARKAGVPVVEVSHY